MKPHRDTAEPRTLWSITRPRRSRVAMTMLIATLAFSLLGGSVLVGCDQSEPTAPIAEIPSGDALLDDAHADKDIALNESVADDEGKPGATDADLDSHKSDEESASDEPAPDKAAPDKPSLLDRAKQKSAEALAASKAASSKAWQGIKRLAGGDNAKGDEEAGILSPPDAPLAVNDKPQKQPDGTPKTDDADKLPAVDLETLEINLATESKKLDRKLNGWLGKGYRKVRSVPVEWVFKGLAAAAEQAAKTNSDELPDAVKKSADLAAQLAERMVGPKRLDNGKPDWQAIQQAMEDGARGKGTSVKQTIALAYMLIGGKRFALYELESIDEASLDTPKEQARFFALRGVVRGLSGFEYLGIRDLELAEKLFDADGEGMDDRTRAGLRLFMSAVHMYNNKLAQADALLGKINRKYPNNPVAVFLTGERLAANGEHEKAAASLEAVLANTKHKWLADQIAERAKQFRDNPDQAKPLLFDEVFFLGLAKAYILDSADESKALAKLKDWMGSLTQLGAKLKEKLPEVKLPKFLRGADEGEEGDAADQPHSEEQQEAVDPAGEASPK